MAYFEGEIPVVTTGYNNNNGGFGNGWEGLIGLALVAGLFDGGFGFGGGNRGGYGFAPSPATQADLAAGFNNSAVLSSLNDIKLTQASNLNFINQGFAGLNNTINQGFAGVDNAICTLGYQNQAGFNALGTQLASCCCDIRQAISDCCCTTQRSIDRVSYENAKNTCDIIRAGQDNTRAILDYLTTEKISSLQAENSGLKAQISNDRQTRTIVNELRDGCPIPAYLTCNPNAPFGYGYGVPFTNCGCTNIQ
jgi:hypothetical protein